MNGRLSNGMPISPHITDLMFPQSYALSATDLAYIVGKRKLMEQEEAKPLMELLESKRIGAKSWRLDYIYSHKGYRAFGTKSKPSEWLSSLLPLWLEHTPHR